MKLYRTTIALLATLFFGGLFVACDEENTLEGADKVYITLNPSNITLHVGDTVKFSAEVVNLSGEAIETPIEWSVLDESVAQIVGDSAVVCANDAQNKTTHLKAMLENGQYALAEISVLPNTPQGVAAVDTAGVVITSKQSYHNPHDSVVFAINPKVLLYDYEPQVTFDKVTKHEEYGVTVDKDNGRVIAHFVAPREGGKGAITVTIGEGATKSTGTCEILFTPPSWSSFYGPKFGMQDLNSRPPVGTHENWRAYLDEIRMDINSEASSAVAINVIGGYEEDIIAAYDSYRWEAVPNSDGSASAVVVAGMENVYYPGNGFDAILTVRSGMSEGSAEFHCITADTTLIVTFVVENYKERYPVEYILANEQRELSLSMRAGETQMVLTDVYPGPSYAVYKPQATIAPGADETIVEIGEYIENSIPIKGLKAGKTEILLTANEATMIIPVEVTESIQNVVWDGTRVRSLFEGQSTEWAVKVYTASGESYTGAVNWSSSEATVADAAASATKELTGVITAYGAGVATITAEVAGKKAEDKVTIVKASDYTLAATEFNEDNAGLQTIGNDRLINFYLDDGTIIQVLLEGKGNADGTFTAPETSMSVTINDATAPVSAGSITVTAGTSTSTITMDLTVQVGEKSFKLTGSNLVVGNW